MPKNRLRFTVRKGKPPDTIRDSAMNANGLVDVAKAAAKAGHFGAAVALEVLALEEAAKAQVLGMLWIEANAGIKVDYPAQLLDQVLSNDHVSRHAFASVQMWKQDLYRRLGEGDPFRRDPLDPPFAESRLIRRVKWLNAADKLKQRGLYVDPGGGSTPTQLDEKDYDEAVAIVEPYVRETLRQVVGL